MQVEKDIKKILLDWNYREQTKILVKEYYKWNYSNISIDGYEWFDINGKKWLDLWQYDYYAISSATINDGISEYVNFRVMEDVYRDTIDNTVINIGTKWQNQENLNKIDFLLMHIFDMAYIVERNELLGKEYDEVEKYLCKVLHNAIDFHSYWHISMSKMITNKENYPNIKDYHANNGIDIMQQGIIDVFNQIEPFNTATFNSLLRNKDSALLSRMKKYYSKEYNKILNKILLIGFLFTYYSYLCKHLSRG